MPYTPPVFATVADLVAYTEGLTAPTPAGADEARIKRIIERAEIQVDNLLTWTGEPLAQDATESQPAVYRSLDPADISAADRYFLSRAVCAQAEYRLQQGEAFFSSAQYERAKGPEFETTGRLPNIGPKVWEELSRLTRTIYTPAGKAFSGRPFNPEIDLWD